MPILMVTEKSSAISIPGLAEVMSQFSDNITFREVSKTGHWVQLEARHEVNDFLEEFFSQSAGAS
jgi:pimeloyl-ACP methyl ester carboxylesterase